jgi:hypothetical protein
MRAWAQAIGWHQSIGAITPYASELLATLRALAGSVPAISTAKWVQGASDTDDDAPLYDADETVV